MRIVTNAHLEGAKIRARPARARSAGGDRRLVIHNEPKHGDFVVDTKYLDPVCGADASKTGFSGALARDLARHDVRRGDACTFFDGKVRRRPK